jgi:thiamine biosynthesis lipoprotein ApbE
MDLATVKALVKAWEKTFKSENGRNPTKEDIKADSTGIGEF